MGLLGPDGQEMDAEARDALLAQARDAVANAIADDKEDAAPPASPDDAAPTHLTGFWVTVDFTGAAMASTDLAADYRFARAASFTDMWAACSQVAKDIASTETAHRVVQMMMQQAAAAQQQLDLSMAKQAVLADPTGQRLGRQR